MSNFRKAQSLEDAKTIIEKIVESQSSVLLWQQIEDGGQKLQVNAGINNVKIIQKKIYVEIYCDSEIINRFDSSTSVFLGELQNQLAILKGNLIKISKFTYHLEIAHPSLLKEFREDKRVDLFEKNLKLELSFQIADTEKTKIDTVRLESISMGGFGVLVPSGMSTKYQAAQEIYINSFNAKTLSPALKANVVYTKVSKRENALGGSLVHIGIELENKLEMSEMAKMLTN